MLGSSPKYRKPAFHPLKRGNAKQRIQAYIEDPSKTTQSYGEDLQQYISAQGLYPFFHCLHSCLSLEMLTTQRRNTILTDGVYILLQGQVTYVWVPHRYDRDRKQNLFALAKNNTFTALNENCFQNQNSQTNGYSLSICKPFAIIECEMGNFMTNDECSFIRIDEQVVELTQFHRLKEERNALLDQCRFHHAICDEYRLQDQQIFHVNESLHHTFVPRTINFRNKFSTKIFGVLVQGVVAVKLTSGMKIELTNGSALLSDFQYDVYSSSAKILQIQDNPTFYFRNPNSVFQFLLQNCEKFAKRQARKMQMSQTLPSTSFHPMSVTKMLPSLQKMQQQRIDNYRTKISSSLRLNKISQSSQDRTSEMKKRMRQVSSVSKECETYCIIPMPYCRQNLRYARNINKKNIPRDQKIKNPQVLFNWNKRNGKKTSGESPFLMHKEEESEEQNVKNKTMISKSSQLLSRYQNFSKEMYDKFIVQKNNNNNRLSQYCPNGSTLRVGQKKWSKVCTDH